MKICVADRNIVNEIYCHCLSTFLIYLIRHLFTRVNEHQTSDKISHISKHLSDSSHCRSLSFLNSFKILDQAATEYELRIKEAISVQLEKPSLNKQVKHVNLKLFL